MSESVPNQEKVLSGDHFEIESEGDYLVSNYRRALLFMNTNLAALNAFHLKNSHFREGGETFQKAAREINSKVIEGVKFAVFFKVMKGEKQLSVLGYNEEYGPLESKLYSLLGNPQYQKIITGVSITNTDIIISTSTRDGRRASISLLALVKEMSLKHKEAKTLFVDGVGKSEIEKAMDNDGNVAQSYHYADKESAYAGYLKMTEAEKESLGMDSDGLVFLGLEKVNGTWFAVFTNTANIRPRVAPDTWHTPTLGYTLETLKLRKAGLSGDYGGATRKGGSSISTRSAIDALEAKQ